MFRLIERERTPLVVMLYAVYMYFQGLSLRAVSACLEDLCLEGKAQRSLDVMKRLDAKYGELSSQVQSDFTKEFQSLEQCQSLPRLLMV